MNIGIDIDDTISNTYEIAIGYARNFVKNDLNRVVEEDYNHTVDHNYIKSIFKLTDEEDNAFWKKYFLTVLGQVIPKKNAVNAINFLKENGNKITIITARWNEENFDAYKDSEKWLNAQGIKFDKLITGANEKGKIAKNENIDVFIDDSIKNCEDVSDMGIKSYLISTPMNKYYQIEKATRVNSWDEILEKIKEEN